MWSRLSDSLRCPLSGAPLELAIFHGSSVDLEEGHVRRAEILGIEAGINFRYQVTDGLLLSESMGIAYPISRGLPVLLPYETAIHRQFAGEFTSELARFRPKYRFPSALPAAGETAVLKSFSTQWENYEYDGVIWDLSYEDNQQRLLSEIGPLQPGSKTFLEVGCGVGVTTYQAQRCFGADAVGVDLSLAVLNARRRFSDNPFLHFVQASAFHLPFGPNSFDIVYSRGVLHLTYSPQRAFLCITRCCRPNGRTYIWVYGTQSVKASSLRRLVYAAESCLRPVLSRSPRSIATLVLVPIVFGYLAFNRLRRLKDHGVQRYDFKKALHAARDRFTPRYGHRANSADLIRWFREAGYEEIQLVDWSEIPSADLDDYRRNIGIRGTRSAESVATDLSC